MSTLTKYYESNKSENPYTMQGTKDSSRVLLLIDLIRDNTPKGGRILDVGCGDMYLSTVLPEYDWVGVDISNESNQGKCIKLDLESTPYPFTDAEFDTIICSEVLEHLFDPLKVSQEIFRLLKPGGQYVLSTPNFSFIDHYLHGFNELEFDPMKSWTKEHIHWYSLESHQKILAHSGFLECSYFGADPHFGEFFKEARMVLTSWIHHTLVKPEQDSQRIAERLISMMFKKHMHTIVIITEKPR